MSSERQEPVLGVDQPGTGASGEPAAREYYFHGLHERTVDLKGRFVLPARFRRGDIQSEKYAVALAPDKILTIYPCAEWQRKMARFAGQAVAKEQRGRLRRQSADSDEVSPDEQGRLMVPRRLLDEVGIQGKVLVVGMGRYLEVWAPERYAAAAAEVPPPDDEHIAEFYR
jgi:MraZ protein